MTARRTALLVLAALLCLAPAAAAQPPKAKSIDDMIAELVELRKRRADDAKADAALVAAITAQLKKYQDLMAELGVLPPGPGPKPPAPDELREKLAAAFKADRGTKEQAKLLASIWSEAAKLVLKKNAAGEWAVASSAKLIEAVREVSNDKDWLGPDALALTRALIAELWVPIFGPEPSDRPLTEAQRAAAADLFGRVAAALEAL
jgi:hypothetical protein